DEWRPFTADELASFNMLENTNYFLGLRRKEASAITTFVILDFVAQDLNGKTAKQLAQGLAGLHNIGVYSFKGGSLRSLVDRSSIRDGVFDDDKNRAIARFEKRRMDGRLAHTISIGMIGSEGIIWLHCRALDDDMERHLPTFIEIADSF